MAKNITSRGQLPAANAYTRQAPERATSFNGKSGTFTAVIATSTPVLRRDIDGEYLEILSLNPNSVRLERLQSGAAPVLDSHRAGSARDQIGIVTDVRIENGQLVATARLSARDDVKPIAADLAGGTPPNVSLGYRVYASTESVDADGRTVVTQTDWEPYEMSLVAIPADPKTHIRSQKGPHMEHDEEINANNNDDNNSDRPNDQNTRTMPDREARQIYDLTARSGLPADFARQYIESGGSHKNFRAKLFERLAGDADRTRNDNIRGASNETFDNPEFLSRSIEDALYARMTGKAPTGAAVELAGRSMLEMGAMILQSRGERVSWANRSNLASQMMERSFGGMHTTSDFPILLTGAGQRVMQDAYHIAQSPLKALARRKTAADFRPISAVRLSEAPRLLKLTEAGEIKHGTRVEAKEGFRVETYARIFSISRAALVNDDLDAFANTSADFGRASAETEADLLAGLLLANSGDGAKLDDGNALYGTARGNKAATGTAITVAALGAGRQVLREMKGLDGITPISVTPKHLVVGAAKETEAEQVLAAIAAAQVGETNPFSGKLTLHVEPRLAGNSWRLFADPSEVATLIIAYLSGSNGPQIDIRDGWNVLGAEFRAVLDFGCAVQDWRGTYLNPGA